MLGPEHTRLEVTVVDEITLTVDGQEIKARKGQTIIEAAREAGIYIPYLCWHPTLKAFGACRMCVVQVERMRGTPASCTTGAMDGMVVTTKGKAIDGIRHNIMDLILSEHPHGCLTCPRIDHCGPQDICLRHANVVDRCVLCPQNERCELQDVVYHLQMKDSDLPYEYRHEPLNTSNPFIDHDMNLCIVCGRCVRACNEIEGVKRHHLYRTWRPDSHRHVPWRLPVRLRMHLLRRLRRRLSCWGNHRERPQMVGRAGEIGYHNLLQLQRGMPA